jgi:hypothetical protein
MSSCMPKPSWSKECCIKPVITTNIKVCSVLWISWFKSINIVRKLSKTLWFITPKLLEYSLLNSIGLLIVNRIMKLKTLIWLDLLDRDLWIINHWCPVMRQKKLHSMYIPCLKVCSRATCMRLSMSNSYPMLFWISSSNLKFAIRLCSYKAHNSKACLMRVIVASNATGTVEWRAPNWMGKGWFIDKLVRIY